MSAGADFTRSCAGCEYIRTEQWPVKGSYRETTVAFRCFAPGPRRGRHMGTGRLFPYIPAWCPKRNAGPGRGMEDGMKSRIENNITRLCRPCAGGGACTVKRIRGKRRTGPEQAEEEEGI